MLPVPEWLQRAAGNEIMLQVLEQDRKWAGCLEQPVPGINGAVPKVAVAGHEERQTDGHSMRLFCRSPKATGLGQGASHGR